MMTCAPGSVIGPGARSRADNELLMKAACYPLPCAKAQFPFKRHIPPGASIFWLRFPFIESGMFSAVLINRMGARCSPFHLPVDFSAI